MPGACEPWPGKRKASLLIRLDDFAAGVVAAIRTDRVLEARTLAVLAGLQVGHVQREMRAPAPLASLRQLYLRKSHEPIGKFTRSGVGVGVGVVPVPLVPGRDRRPGRRR